MDTTLWIAILLIVSVEAVTDVRRNCFPYENAAAAGCLHGGWCRNRGQLECECPLEWYGRHCEIRNRQCEIDRCQHGGLCVLQKEGRFVCDCPRGFYGSFCTDNRVCSVTRCRNGGTCVPTIEGARCQCKQYFTGRECEVMPVCSTHPCMHNMPCILSDKEAAGFKCECKYGYVGKRCEYGVFQPCIDDPCPHENMLCVPMAESIPPYICKCPLGFKGPECETKMQNCVGNPCLHGGTCTETGGNIQCACHPPDSGMFCEISDEDVYEDYSDEGPTYEPIGPPSTSVWQKVVYVVIAVGVGVGLLLLLFLYLAFRRYQYTKAWEKHGLAAQQYYDYAYEEYDQDNANNNTDEQAFLLRANRMGFGGRALN